MRPAKIQISLRLLAVWSESSLITCARYSPLPSGYRKRDKREPLQNWVDVQADRSLCWLYRSDSRFCHAIQNKKKKKKNEKNFLTASQKPVRMHYTETINLTLPKLFHVINICVGRKNQHYTICNFMSKACTTAQSGWGIYIVNSD